jgi:hypothetical protein
MYDIIYKAYGCVILISICVYFSISLSITIFYFWCSSLLRQLSHLEVQSGHEAWWTWCLFTLLLLVVYSVVTTLLIFYYKVVVVAVVVRFWFRFRFLFRFRFRFVCVFVCLFVCLFA